jgi:hypothetical protein
MNAIIKHRKKHEPMTSGTLIDMYTYCRRAWEPGEKAFLNRYLGGYPTDHIGNVRIEVDAANSRTLFSCHTDSVHKKDDLRQKVFIDDEFGEAFKHDGRPLGADDATGLWLMLHMIQQEVPGTYIFHRGEEVGGVGSKWVVANDKDFLTLDGTNRFDRTIAFDRRGTADVITKMSAGITCSNEFAKALCVELGGSYAPSDQGSFTDTASYRNDIPECTNVSCGYDHEHTQDETQDLLHAEVLYEAVTSIQWELLPTSRDHLYVPPAPVYDFYTPGKHNNTKGHWQGAKFVPKTTAKQPPLEKVYKGTKNGVPGNWHGTVFIPSLPGKALSLPPIQPREEDGVWIDGTFHPADLNVKAGSIDVAAEFFSVEDALTYIEEDPEAAAELLFKAYECHLADLVSTWNP